LRRIGYFRYVVFSDGNETRIISLGIAGKVERANSVG
jgi:hypothetical protein